MKARGGLAILVCALAALALPPPATASPSKGISLSSVKLEESNGYELEFTAVRFDKRRPVASVTARRGIASASYTVRPASGAGTHATFGTLGRVDLAFHRHKKVVDRPEKHCRWIFESGVFRGGFSFVGEGGYVADEAVDPEGTVLRLPNGFCGLGNFRPGLPPGLPRETVLAALARTDSGEVSFRASRLRTGNGPILFRASTRERVQGVDISRSVRTQGRKGDFTATGASRGAASLPRRSLAALGSATRLTGAPPGPARSRSRYPGSRASPSPGKTSPPVYARASRSSPAACRDRNGRES